MLKLISTDTGKVKSFIFSALYDFKFPATFLPHKLCDLQRSYWPRGKVLGGSSSINAMIYIRGSRHDYDKWAKDGAQGWSYKDVLPYFLKSEDNINADFVKTGKKVFCVEGRIQCEGHEN